MHLNRRSESKSFPGLAGHVGRAMIFPPCLLFGKSTIMFGAIYQIAMNVFGHLTIIATSLFGDSTIIQPGWTSPRWLDLFFQQAHANRATKYIAVHDTTQATAPDPCST
jgi:hypothetical protein